MPKYRFVCDVCRAEKTLYVSASEEKRQCDSCSANMTRQLPSSGSQAVTEVVDSFTGVKQLQDQKAILKERRDEHYWKNEVPRLVERYSLETCLEQGWLVLNDKGELVIGKAPSKR